jgi:hypothetical protein
MFVLGTVFGGFESRGRYHLIYLFEIINKHRFGCCVENPVVSRVEARD